MSDQPASITTVEDLLEFCADDPPGCTSIHIDHTGTFTCGTRPTALDSLEQWATYPKRIVDAANDRLTCGRRWIIFVRQDTSPTEMDARHYNDLVDILDHENIELVDVVIAWNDQHVSMRSLRHRNTRYDDSTGPVAA